MALARRAVLVNGLALTMAPPVLAGDAKHPDMICLDTHLDTPEKLEQPGWDVMARHDVDTGLSQVDVPRMRQGGLDGGFWAVYTPQGPLTPEAMMAARDAALMRAVEIRQMVAAHPDTFELAFEAADAARIKRAGKIIVFQSIENSYPLANDISLLRSYYKFGVRMVGPVHFRVNQFGDSATDKPHWNGLSPAGKELAALANDLGMVLDASHSADSVFDDLISLSRAPIMCSHSGCRAVHDHPRNLDDARIKTLAAKGGTIQINSYNNYLVSVPPNPDRSKAEAALEAQLKDLSSMTPEQATATVRTVAMGMKALDKQYPQPRATLDDFMRHVTHALDLVGPDHVGVGADWDGGGGVAGMEDVAALPRVTERLVKLGYTDAQLAQFWGGNALRVLKAAHDARKI